MVTLAAGAGNCRGLEPDGAARRACSVRAVDWVRCTAAVRRSPAGWPSLPRARAPASRGCHWPPARGPRDRRPGRRTAICGKARPFDPNKGSAATPSLPARAIRVQESSGHHLGRSAPPGPIVCFARVDTRERRSGSPVIVSRATLWGIGGRAGAVIRLVFRFPPTDRILLQSSARRRFRQEGRWIFWNTPFNLEV